MCTLCVDNSIGHCASIVRVDSVSSNIADIFLCNYVKSHFVLCMSNNPIRFFCNYMPVTCLLITLYVLQVKHEMVGEYHLFALAILATETTFILYLNAVCCLVLVFMSWAEANHLTRKHISCWVILYQSV